MRRQAVSLLPDTPSYTSITIYSFVFIPKTEANLYELEPFYYIGNINKK